MNEEALLDRPVNQLSHRVPEQKRESSQGEGLPG